MSDLDSMEHSHEEFKALSLEVRDKLKCLVEGTHEEESMHEGIESGLEHAKRLLEKLELQAISVNPDYRATPMTTVTDCKQEWNSLHSQYKKYCKSNLNEGYKDERSLLFSGRGGTPDDIEAGIFSPRDRLLGGQQTARLQPNEDSLTRSHLMALEAEQIGSTVLGDLRRQREQIQNANRTLQDTDRDLGQSNRILRDMLRRMAANRILTTALIIALVGAILLVLYYKIFH